MDLKTLPALCLALGWLQSTSPLWHVAKWLALCAMFSRTRQCWFWFMSPGAKSNSTQFIKPQLSAHHVVPTMPKDDKTRTCQKVIVSKRHSSSWMAWFTFMPVSPWPHQSAHVLLPGSVEDLSYNIQYNPSAIQSKGSKHWMAFLESCQMLRFVLILCVLLTK